MTQSEDNLLDRIESQLKNVVTSLKQLTTDVEGLKQEVNQTNLRVEIYQKASGQVVNLAFSLIVAATAAIIVPALINR